LALTDAGFDMVLSRHFALGLLCFVAGSAIGVEKVPPKCRLDDTYAADVSQALQAAGTAYASMGKALQFDKVVVNPPSASLSARTLDVYLVKDAAEDALTQGGCASVPIQKDDILDDLSVRGACTVPATGRLELRCSSESVRTFDIGHGRLGRASPALLYVLAHELGHVYQNRPGEYIGRVETIDLSHPQTEKLKQLREACDPSSVRIEAEADAMAVEVLKRLVVRTPYREPAFSEQGSVYWAIDQLNLAANTWQDEALEREFVSQPKPHRSFVPTEFPTSAATVRRNAQAFVCEVLTKRHGIVSYPLRSVDHPPLEQRMRQVAAALAPIAKSLPSAGAREQFKSFAVLQQQLGPLFSQIYVETGVYMQEVRRQVCTRVNAEVPTRGC
jgi:hypothetical protein